MKLGRRPIFALAAAAILVILSVAHRSVVAELQAGAGAVSKQAALDSIARNVLLPGYSELAARSGELAAAADVLSSTPNITSLRGAQQAWRAVLLAWRRTQSFSHGPVADLGVGGRIQFWPSRRQTVDRVLRAARPIDDGYIQELGANAVGLSALEILLFDIRQDDAARLGAFTGLQGDRQRKYFQALTRDLMRKTRLLESAWDGPAGYAAKFSSGGQNHLNLLVNDLLAAVESGAQARLQLAMDRHTEPNFLSDLVEGGPSGTSQQGLLALFLGAQAAFSGGDGVGLDDYLRQVGSRAAPRIETQFRKTIAAVRALDSPLEQAIVEKEQAVKQAHAECRALEVMLKVDLASALGVTLTFKSTDGD